MRADPCNTSGYKAGTRMNELCAVYFVKMCACTCMHVWAAHPGVLYLSLLTHILEILTDTHVITKSPSPAEHPIRSRVEWDITIEGLALRLLFWATYISNVQSGD